jgi:hypothetical protein
LSVWGGIAGNILTQKYIVGNPSPTGLILAGKLLSTSLTTAAGLSVRMCYPKQMDRLDETISKRVFAPMFKEGAVEPEESITTHAERLRKQTDNYMAQMMR